MDFKMWVLQGHYRSERDFSFDNLDSAKSRRQNWRNRIAETYQTTTQPTDLSAILEAASNDLNSPQAFSLIDQVKDADLSFWQQVDQLFGLNLIQDSPDIDEETKKILNLRWDAKLRKDFTEADRLRALLLEKGIAIQDSNDRQIWQYAG